MSHTIRGRRTKRSAVVALLTGLTMVVAGLSAGTAQADPTKVLTWSFTGCSGPAGTLSSFTAVREERSSAAAFHVVDSRATFVVVVFVDTVTGTSFSPPGLASSGNVTVTCSVVSPISGHLLLLSGFIAGA